LTARKEEKHGKGKEFHGSAILAFGLTLVVLGGIVGEDA
jgi:hypothetical protein